MFYYTVYGTVLLNYKYNAAWISYALLYSVLLLLVVDVKYCSLERCIIR